MTIIFALDSTASSTTWLFVRINPALSIINPEPVLPEPVVIETTEGKTLFAKPATESGLRSTELDAETRFALPPKNPPDAFIPSAPPTIPAMIAKTTTEPGLTPLRGCEKS